MFLRLRTLAAFALGLGAAAATALRDNVVVLALEATLEYESAVADE